MSLGSPLQKAAPRSVTQDFRKLVLILQTNLLGGKSQTHTHTGTVSTAVCCGAVRNCRKPMEEDAKKKKKRGKAGREEAVFL